MQSKFRAWILPPCSNAAQCTRLDGERDCAQLRGVNGHCRLRGAAVISVDPDKNSRRIKAEVSFFGLAI